ncbi:MAG: hypothetical protein ABWW69_04435 [Pyrodictiaceae archaeon]
MARKPDFLRQIVNRILAESRLPSQVVDDIRKQIAYAEERYKFSSFGGNVEKLADYILSKDFDTLIQSFKSANGIEELKRIMTKAMEAYKDVPSVVEAIEKRLKEIERVREESTK